MFVLNEIPSLNNTREKERSMSFIKTAAAKIVKGHESISVEDWLKIAGKGSFNSRVASRVIKNYDPDKYLLTHCTIIASVNIDDRVPHYITPETEQFVNNNYDSWESGLLSKPDVYKSFEGAYNYLEHVQVPSLAKGKVIGAALREVPLDNTKDPVYFVDILVATDKKHSGLISKISSGQLNTLSMGCQVAYTYCSKCGHKAFDETDLCNHIKYQKGNHFIDEFGKRRIIAELCGHKKDPSSVRFIEASWVAIPAFSGAVLRNILTFQNNEVGKVAKQKYARLIEDAYSIDPTEGLENLMKAASTVKVASTSNPADLVRKLENVFNSLNNRTLPNKLASIASEITKFKG